MILLADSKCLDLAAQMCMQADMGLHQLLMPKASFSMAQPT